MKLEEDCRKGHTRDLFVQVRTIWTPFQACKGIIKDKNGRVLTDQQDIRGRWQEYTRELYASTSNGEQPNNDPVEIEPAILNEEVIWTVQQLPNNKAPGFYCIPAEMLRPIPSVAIKAICLKSGNQEVENISFYTTTKERRCKELLQLLFNSLDFSHKQNPSKNYLAAPTPNHRTTCLTGWVSPRPWHTWQHCKSVVNHWKILWLSEKSMLHWL